MNLKVVQAFMAVLLVAVILTAPPAFSQSALESNQQQLQGVDEAEDGVIVRGGEFAEKLWDSATSSVEGEASKDIAALKVTPVPDAALPLPTVTTTSPTIATEGDSNADIEADIDQLADAAKDE